MTDMTVANTILEQLGGHMFALMTGAKNFSGTENSLTFKIPNAQNKITHIIITLEPSDTYTVEFYNCRITSKGLKRELVESINDVYCDMLQDVFEQHTGLYTHM
jgi:hypothetical protein